ncbi:DUF523 domain-containing protein [Pluralibacter gergoviae]
MGNKILISACLMGYKVRYNGSAKAEITARLDALHRAGRLVVHCPELAAGLPTPRLPAEIDGDSGSGVLAGRARIIENNGCDATPHYMLAAWLALETARKHGCSVALLTDGSPTCGSREIYDGSFSNQLRPGEGVAAALLRQHGIKVFSDKEIPALLDWLTYEEQNNDSV